MKSLLLMETMAEVEGIMRCGAQLVFSEVTGKIENIPFSQLDRQGKIELLAYGIDWTERVNCGMKPIDCDRIVMNAVDGKPQERWLEAIANEQQEIAGLSATIHEKIDTIYQSIAERLSRSSPTLARLLERFVSRAPRLAEIDQSRER
jgi:hypothetical protein